MSKDGWGPPGAYASASQNRLESGVSTSSTRSSSPVSGASPISNLVSATMIPTGSATETARAYRASATSRTRAARAINWVSGAPATDSVQFVARFKHLRLGIGSVAAVTIDACDTTCTTITKDVTVVQGTATDDHGRNHPEDNPPAPLPAGSVTIDQAVAAALASVGPGSTLILVKRDDDPGVAYEVKVRSADGSRVEVKIAADGTVVSSHVEKHADK